MTKQQLRLFVEGPLNVLKQGRYAHEVPVDGFVYKECGYHQWKCIDDTDGWQPIDLHYGFGGHEYHAIFKTTLHIPQKWKSEEVRLRVETGADDIWNFNNPQFLVFLDGQIACGLDVRHTEVDLPQRETIELALYAYVNTKKPDVFLQTSLYRVNEELEAFLYDLGVVYETALTVEEGSGEFILLAKSCIETLKAVDFSSLEALQDPRMLSKARGVLKSLITGKYSPTEAEIAVIGHSHIDLAWLWTVDQTREKALRSYATVLSLMDKYPDYTYTSSQMQLLSFVKHDMPELYKKIQMRAAEGRWEIEGATWVEMDTILTSGESLARQFYWGRKYSRDEFNKDCTTLWLPDCFGYTATLPQIIKGAGIDQFVTTKLSWNETNRFPHDVFMWKGLDGTEVFTYLISSSDYESIASYPKKVGFQTTYNGIFTPNQILGTRQRFTDKELPQHLYLYGYGDGGGGPTRSMLENHKRIKEGIPGLPKTYSTTIASFLKEARKQLSKLPVWDGELYLEYHRGTYTSMAEVKRLNRLSEQNAFSAEFYNTLAATLDTEWKYPYEQFEKMWKLLGLNQFHDILPGSSIKEVYDTTLVQLKQVSDAFAEEADKARTHLASLIASEADGVVVFNTLDFERSDLCTIDAKGWATVTDEDGKLLPSHTTGDKLTFLAANVPSKGWKRFRLVSDSNTAKIPFAFGDGRLTTPYYEVEFGSDGCMKRLYDTQLKREVLKGEGNRLSLSVDHPMEFDAWNIGKQGFEMKYVFDGRVEYRIVSASVLSIVLEAQWKWLKSTYRQTITFHAHTKRIDFNLAVDWHEDHLMLRTGFEVDVRSLSAAYDIAYGVCERTTHTNTSWDEVQFEVPAHKWVDYSDRRFGVALLSRQSYGYSAKDGMLTLSLLRAPTYPNPVADRGLHELCYALLPHTGDYLEGKVVQEGYALHQTLTAEVVQAKKGVLGTTFSFVQIEGDGVVLETIKQCETRPSVLVRLINTAGFATEATVSSSLPVEERWLCNLVEDRIMQLESSGHDIHLPLKGHEIVTLELVLRKEKCT